MPIRKKATTAKPKPTKAKPMEHSKLEVFDINVEDLIPDEDNPNEMDEATFDQLIEEIREQGFDEPIQVRRSPKTEGKYEIGSGHHRTKAAIVLGMTTVPAIIKEWDDRQIKVALVKRNVLRGDPNKQKLTKLYRDLVKGKDAAVVQREMGYVNPKKFEAMVESVEKSLPPKQRKKLQDAKETIKSVDDLSSVLNRIFKDQGSELDKGYMVFSFGGKKHHYYQIDDTTNAKLEAIMKECDKQDVVYSELMQSIVAGFNLQDIAKSGKQKPEQSKPAVKRRPKPKK